MKSLIILLLVTVTAFAQTPYTDFETSLVHPLVISPSGNRLFALNSPAGRLLVYDLSKPMWPQLISEISVGLAPTSVAALNDDEVWVVDALSDSLSVVRVSRGEVVAVIPTGDDPADIVFAGTPMRAFVSEAGEDRISAFDVATRTLLASVQVPMKEPRALAVDTARGRVWALSFRSGNRTTVIPSLLAPPPPLPLDPNLPLAPQQALIVSLDDPQWAMHPVNLPDIDAIAFDATTFAPAALVQGIGTINFDLTVDPITGGAVVVGFDSRNDEVYEPVVRARFIRNQIALVHPTGAGVVPIDLDAPLATTNLPDDYSRRIALAEPAAVALDLGRRRIWIAAQGTDRLAEFSDQGDLLRRIDLAEDPLLGARGTKRGPRGLVLHSSGDIAYVYERLAHRIAVVDLVSGNVLRELSLGLDPLDATLRQGRAFLYDALLSGNGSASCAACHIDAEYDLLAWDLGDPSGAMTPVPPQPPRPDFPPNSFPPFDFHPMKGPMVTQTLRGLAGNKPFHWRGDKADIEDFNGAFVSLMGGNLLHPAEMTMMADWVRGLSHQPNPHQNPDRSFSANAQAGKTAFETLPSVDFGGGFTLKCIDCHSEVDGSGPVTVLPLPLTFIGPSQPTNTPQLRGLYRRGAASITGAPSKVGFGFSHDGGLPDLRFFLDIPAFSLTPTAVKDDMAEFLRSFDSGVAPAVGRRFRLDATTANGAAFLAEIQLLESRAITGEIDLVAIGQSSGAPLRLHFDPQVGLYVSSRDGRYQTRSSIESLAALGAAELVFMATPPGESQRFAIDVDQDALPDYLGSGVPRGSSSTGPLGPLTLRRIPRAERWPGERLVLNGLPGGTQALLVVTRQPADYLLSGLRILVDPTTMIRILPIQYHGSGIGTVDISGIKNKHHVQAWVQTTGNPPVSLYTSNALSLR